MIGSLGLRCSRSVSDSLLRWLDGSLLGRLRGAMLIDGLSRLGRNTLMSLGSRGVCVASSALVIFWQKSCCVWGLLMFACGVCVSSFVMHVSIVRANVLMRCQGFVDVVGDVSVSNAC